MWTLNWILYELIVKRCRFFAFSSIARAGHLYGRIPVNEWFYFKNLKVFSFYFSTCVSYHSRSRSPSPHSQQFSSAELSRQSTAEYHSDYDAPTPRYERPPSRGLYPGDYPTPTGGGPGSRRYNEPPPPGSRGYDDEPLSPRHRRDYDTARPPSSQQRHSEAPKSPR